MVGEKKTWNSLSWKTWSRVDGFEIQNQTMDVSKLAEWPIDEAFEIFIAILKGTTFCINSHVINKKNV